MEQSEINWKQTFKNQTFWVFRSLLLGIIIGPACYLLSYLIGLAGTVRDSHWWLIFALPLAGAFISWGYNRIDPVLRESSGTTMEIINWNIRKRTNPTENPDAPQKSISPWLAPVILVSTLISHIFGASIGKEGAGVQVGTSISSFLARTEMRLMKSDSSQDMGIWLCIGSGAAFGALFKAPIAGTLFGIMVASPNIARFDAMLPCLVGSLVASFISSSLSIGTPFVLGVVDLPWSIKNALIALCLGVAAGLLARLFFVCSMTARKLSSRLLPNQYVRTVVLSFVLVLCFVLIYLATGSLEYCSLSASLMNDSRPWSFVIKILLTVISLAAGFTGGEVVPTLVIGASAFRALGLIIPLPLPTLAVFGAIGMLSGATNLPLVCFALGLEVFGFANFEYLFIICVMSFIVSGRDSIYPNQLKA